MVAVKIKTDINIGIITIARIISNSKATEVRMRKLFVVLLVAMTAACNSKQVFHERVTFDDSEWCKDSVVRFSVDVTDTVQTYDVVFSIVNEDDYPYANLYLFTDIIFPNRQFLRDTVEFMLSTNDGQWLGSGMNGYENNFQFKSNVRFPQCGTYVFAFEQAMRCKNNDCCVEGIKSVSLSLNKK